MTLSLNDKIEYTWKLRFEQQNEVAFRTWCELRDELGLVGGVFNSEDIKAALLSQFAKEKIEIIILKASLNRAQKQVKESNRILETIETEFRSSGSILPCRYNMERGLNHLLYGDFTNALDYFQSAYDGSKSDFEKLVCLTNIITCFDELGMNFQNAFKEAEEILSFHDASIGFSAARTYLNHIKSRKNFRTGNFDGLFNIVEDSTTVDQTMYFKTWVASLPYHKYFDLQKKGIEILARADSTFYQKAYRLRTLNVVLHPDDSYCDKPGEWADRFYLWVWKWLTEPQTFSIRWIASLLLDVNKRVLESSSLSVEDKQLLSNSLLWLSLFSKQSSSKIEQILKNLRVDEDTASPLLDFERLLIFYLLAKRDGDEVLAGDYLNILQANPLHKQKRTYLSLLVDEQDSEPEETPEILRDFFEQISKVTHAAQNQNDSIFQVDLGLSQIVDKRKSEPIISEQIAAAAHLLSEQKVVGCSDFIKEVFGISKYDSSIHGQRVLNLLWRMKQLFAPYISFKTKNSNVTSLGDWSCVRFIGTDNSSKSLKNLAEWQNIGEFSNTKNFANKKTFHNTDLTAKKIQNVLTRKDIEILLGKSRASTNRVLKKWENEGLVKKIGHARNVRYHLKDHIMNYLQGESL